MSRIKSTLQQASPIDPFVEEFKNAMQDAGYSIRILEVRRTPERQAALYAQGRTAPGPVVTWTTQSKHLRGRAFDFAFRSAEQADTEDAWLTAAEIGDGLGLVWGGDWNVQDLSHFELRD